MSKNSISQYFGAMVETSKMWIEISYRKACINPVESSSRNNAMKTIASSLGPWFSSPKVINVSDSILISIFNILIAFQCLYLI